MGRFVVKTATKIDLSVALTRTSMPAPSTMLDAIFLISFNEEPQSIGRIISIRYMSVEALAAKDVQTIVLYLAGLEWSE